MSKILVKDGVEKAFSDAKARELLLDKASGWDTREGELLTVQEGVTARAYDTEEAIGKLEKGAALSSAGEAEARRERAETRERRAYGDEEVSAFGEAALGTLLPVVGDKIAEGISGLAGESEGAGAAKARQNELASTLGTVAGGVVGAVGGVGLGGVAAKAGTAAAKGVTGGRIVKGAVSGAVEGAIFGGGQAISSALLHDKEVTAESVVAGMGGGAMFGGLFGAAGGAIASKAAKSAKAAKLAAKSDDLIAFEQATFKQLDDLKAVRESIKLETKGIKDVVTRKALNNANSIAQQSEAKIARFIGTKPAAYTSKLAKLGPAEAKSFFRAVKSYDEGMQLLGNAAGKDMTALKLFNNVDELAAKAGVKIGPGVSDTAALAELTGVTDIGGIVKDVTGSEMAESAVKMWAVSRALGGAGKVAAKAPFMKGMAGKAMNWSKPSQAMGSVLGRTTNAIGRAKETFTTGLTRALTNGSGLRKGYIPAATSVLGRVSFDADLGEKPKNTGSKQATYQKRVSEIRAAAANPEKYQAKIRERVATLAHLHPESGEATVAQSQKVIDFLASKLKPAAAAFTFGADEGLPTSQADIEELAAYVQGAADPFSIIDDIGQDALDPRAAEAMRELYPQMFMEAQIKIATMPPEEKKLVSWSKQVQLSIFFGVPMHDILRPVAVAAVQEGYAMRAAEAEQNAKDYSTPGKVGNGVGITEPPTATQRLEQ